MSSPIDQLIAVNLFNATQRPDGTWRYNDQNYDDVPNYTTDLNNAFMICGQLRSYEPSLKWVNDQHYWLAEIGYSCYGISNNPAEAICKAALRFISKRKQIESNEN